MRLLVLIFVIGCASGPSRRDPPAAVPPSVAEPLVALAPMVGRWEGTATGGGGEAIACEHVEPKLQGNVLLVEGLGVAEQDGARKIVHQALGVISRAPDGRLLLRAYRGDGL